MAKNHLIWIDLEMTGLSPSNDRIIEIATIVTNYELDIIAEGPCLAISQPKELLDSMDSWNTNQHTKSGLIDRVLESKTSERAAELQTVDFLKEYVNKGSSPMCGNSICQDRRFLANYMPELESYFHYRHLDVSTLKELTKYWYPTVSQGYTKKSEHLALSDIKDSIDELSYYRKEIFK